MFPPPTGLLNGKEETNLCATALLYPAPSHACRQTDHDATGWVFCVNVPVLPHIAYKPNPPTGVGTPTSHRRDQLMASTSGRGLDTPQVQFVLRFLDLLSARNLDAAFSLLSDTLVYELWPASLAHAPRTKSEYKEFLDANPDRDVKVPSFRCDRIHILAALTCTFSSRL